MNNSEGNQSGEGRGSEQNQQSHTLKADLAPHGTITVPQSEANRDNRQQNHGHNGADQPYLHRYNVIGQFLVGVALIFVGVSQCSIYWKQTGIIGDQLREMQTNSTILRYQTAARMALTNIPHVEVSQWTITPEWTNVGKSDALNVTGWDHLQLFDTAADVKKLDFSALPAGESWSHPETKIENEKLAFSTKPITWERGWDEMYGRKMVISWGMIEYDDIFGTHNTIQHCEAWNFRYINGTVELNLPHPLFLGCNRRTQQQKRQE